MALLSPLLTSLAGGYDHRCALLTDNTLKCWGRNSNGQLGLGAYTTPVGATPGDMGDSLAVVDLGSSEVPIQICTGMYHTCAITNNGLKCFGQGTNGKLGLGGTTSRGDQAGEMGDVLPFVNLGTGLSAVQITCGYEQTCALLNDDTVKCWGSGANGRLGYGDTLNKADTTATSGDNLPAIDFGTDIPIRVVSGSAHTCAIMNDYSLRCWGLNTGGRLGLGNTSDQTTPQVVDLGTGAQVVDVALGEGHTCALLLDSTVKCWGENASGELGYGDTSSRGDAAGEMGDSLLPLKFAPGKIPVQISTGQDYTCVMFQDKTLTCFGKGSLGRLGRESVDDVYLAMAPVLDFGSEHVVQVSAAYKHLCALLASGDLKCLGDNAWGKLGSEDSLNWGGLFGSMGDNLPTVNLGTTGQVVENPFFPATPAPTPSPTLSPSPLPPSDVIIPSFFSLPDGGIYMGPLLPGNIMEGRGILTYRQGDVYIGDFENNQRHGQGTYVQAKGKVASLVGTMVNDKWNGNVEVNFHNGNHFLGVFVDGKSDGPGLLTKADGTMVTGEFYEGLLVDGEE